MPHANFHWNPSTRKKVRGVRNSTFSIIAKKSSKSTSQVRWKAHYVIYNLEILPHANFQRNLSSRNKVMGVWTLDFGPIWGPFFEKSSNPIMKSSRKPENINVYAKRMSHANFHWNPSTRKKRSGGLIFRHFRKSPKSRQKRRLRFVERLTMWFIT